MENQNGPLLSVRNLKTYFFQDEGTVKAVDGASFDVYPGKTLGIVGESGCGKSVTSLSILRLVENPGRIVQGEVILRTTGGEELDLVKLAPNSRRIREIRGAEIGLVFQEPMTSFSPVHTVGTQIVEAIRLHSPVTVGEARKRGIEVLRSVGIPKPDRRIDEYSFELSGGLRQRAMIAVALSCNPRLLIADEPTTALDVTIQAQVLELIRKLKTSFGTSTLLITHDLGVVAEMCDTVAVMLGGKIMEFGTLRDIYKEPLHPYTLGLFNSIPDMSVSVRRLKPIRGTVSDPTIVPVGCPFANRCDRTMEICRTSFPSLRKRGATHKVYCHDVEELTS